MRSRRAALAVMWTRAVLGDLVAAAVVVGIVWLWWKKSFAYGPTVIVTWILFALITTMYMINKYRKVMGEARAAAMRTYTDGLDLPPDAERRPVTVKGIRM